VSDKQVIDALCVIEVGWRGESGGPEFLAMQEAKRIIRERRNQAWVDLAAAAHRRMADEIEAAARANPEGSE